MFTNNPFAALTDFLPTGAMQVYIVLMIFAVGIGTLLDAWHKGSAKFFTQRRATTKAAATKQLSSMETFSLAAKTIGEAAVSGEFCKWPRRTSHLLMMYGFLLYIVTTVLMVFIYPSLADTPRMLPLLWDIGTLMIVVGGLWFFFFLRVNVVYDGDPPFHLGRADLFVVSLIASAAFGLIWHFVQTRADHATASLVFFIIYIFLPHYFSSQFFGRSSPTCFISRWWHFSAESKRPTVPLICRIPSAATTRGVNTCQLTPT